MAFAIFAAFFVTCDGTWGKKENGKPDTLAGYLFSFPKWLLVLTLHVLQVKHCPPPSNLSHLSCYYNKFESWYYVVFPLIKPFPLEHSGWQWTEKNQWMINMKKIKIFEVGPCFKVSSCLFLSAHISHWFFWLLCCVPHLSLPLCYSHSRLIDWWSCILSTWRAFNRLTRGSKEKNM